MGAEALRALLDFVMPRVCVVCRKALRGGQEHICPDCRADMPYTGNHLILHNAMADMYNEKISAGIEVYEPYQAAAALINYNSDSLYRGLTWALKYGHNRRLGEYLGSEIGKRIAESPVFGCPDLIVPVPLHWTRQYRRGYNQAAVVARGIGKVLCEAEIEPHLLVRAHRTSSQVRLDAQAKARNVSGAFRLGRESVVGRCRQARHILLVDDVFTTGATAFECHQALRQAFGPHVRISVATIAFRGK